MCCRRKNKDDCSRRNTFIEDFEKNVERIKKDTEAMLSNKETINRVGALMNEKDNNSKRLTGFE